MELTRVNPFEGHVGGTPARSAVRREAPAGTLLYLPSTVYNRSFQGVTCIACDL